MMNRLGILAACVVASQAFAQQAARPTLEPGDRWSFVVWYTQPSTSPNREWIVGTVAADRITGTENGEPLVLTPDLGVLESPRNIESNPQWLRFPLAVGDRWTFEEDYYVKYKNSRGLGKARVAVVGYEKVTVPAGEFDAFKLEATMQLSGISGIGSTIDAEANHTYWYAPEARAIVKWVARNPYLGPSTTELVERGRKP
jgi:hypothetical protein